MVRYTIRTAAAVAATKKRANETVHIASESDTEADGLGASGRQTIRGSRKGLLDLPAEIRLIIYKLVLTDEYYPGNIFLYKQGNRWVIASPSRDCCRSIINLLLVNQQVHDEAVPVLYGINTFRFLSQYGWEPPLRFLESFGQNMGHLVRCCVEVGDLNTHAEILAFASLGQKLCLAPKFARLSLAFKSYLWLRRSPHTLRSSLKKLAEALYPLIIHILKVNRWPATASSIASTIQIHDHVVPYVGGCNCVVNHRIMSTIFQEEMMQLLEPAANTE